MKTSILSLAVFAAFLVPSADAASYHNASYFDSKLSITKRLNDGTLLPAVRKAQTITFQGVPYTSEKAVETNMTHLRRLSVCSTEPASCKSENTTWND